MEGQQQQQQQESAQPQEIAEPPKENGTVVQEASSTTSGEEVVTKRSIRLQIWKKIQEAKCGYNPRMIYNRIPNFIGNDKAAALLAETPEFKNAKSIKVNIDIAQDPVKVEAFNAGKDLYVPPSRDSRCLYTKIECPADADAKLRQKILKIVNWKEHKKDIAVEDKVTMDMVVIGSVVVSRDGYRIGRGNGFVDLDVSTLIHLGVITPETLIVTTVHDLQVTDQLPTHLFEKHDTPVDMIVTPSEVIRVSNRLPRPKGLFWEMLSERRLKIVPVLQVVKENEESAGKVIVLKSEDTDVETNAPQQRQRRRPLFKYRNRRTRSEMNNENEEKEKPRRRRQFTGRRRRQTKSEGEHSSGENKENEQNPGRQQLRKKRSNRDFCIKISKIAKEVRIKDLKAELRKRECNPVYISWKGPFGKCYLHFAKRKDEEKDAAIEKVLKSLNDLTLTVEQGENSEVKQVNLDVELLQIKDDNTIEAVNTTTV